MLSVGREEKEHIIFASKSTSFYYTVQLLNLYKDMLWDNYGIARTLLANIDFRVTIFCIPNHGLLIVRDLTKLCDKVIVASNVVG